MIQQLKKISCLNKFPQTIPLKMVSILWYLLQIFQENANKIIFLHKYMDTSAGKFPNDTTETNFFLSHMQWT